MTPAEQRSAQWVGALFLLVVVLQRIAVPGMPLISVMIPITLLWCAAALHQHIIALDQTRLIGWLGVAVLTGSLMFVQSALVPDAEISANAWALVLAVWLPFTFRLVEGGIPAYMELLRHVTSICTGLAIAALVMVGIQLAGVGYTDWFASVVPSQLQLQGFIVSYPIEYGSEVYKSNAFLGLEPSVVSGLLGVGLLAAILVQTRVWKIVALVLGIASTVAGSGIVTLVAGLIVILCSPARRLLIRYLAVVVVAVVVLIFTQFGELILLRAIEFRSAQSSTSLRALEPYQLLGPLWKEHLSGVLVGYGPGSAQRLASGTNIEGFLIPTPLKIFYEYGLIGGFAVAAFILLCYWGGPSRTFGVSLLVGSWILQSGLATPIVVAPVLVLVTLWSPRTGLPIERTLKVREKPKARYPWDSRSDASPDLAGAASKRSSR